MQRAARLGVAMEEPGKRQRVAKPYARPPLDRERRRGESLMLCDSIEHPLAGTTTRAICRGQIQCLAYDETS